MYRKCGMCSIRIENYQNSYITLDDTILCGDTICWNDWCHARGIKKVKEDNDVQNEKYNTRQL